MAGFSENLRGALFMSGSMAAFTANDALMKSLAGDVPLTQAIFMRGVVTTLLMLMLARLLGGLQWRIPAGDRWRLAVRSCTDVLTSYFFLTALFHMPIANATAILQSLPLTVTLAGAIFLGETVGWRRYLAICVGFLGVLLVVKPGLEGFSIYGVYALVAVALVTVRDLVTRGMSNEVPTLTIALVNAVGVMIAFGVVTAFQPWTPITATTSWAILGASVTIILAYTCAVSAMRHGEISAVTPFRYTGLLWALLLGWLFFADWPDVITLCGAGLIVASGLFAFHRQRQSHDLTA